MEEDWDVDKLTEVFNKYEHIFIEVADWRNYLLELKQAKRWAIEVETLVKDERDLEDLFAFRDAVYKGNLYAELSGCHSLVISPYRAVINALLLAQPPWRNAVIRGVMFGISNDKIIRYMRNTGETQA